MADLIAHLLRRAGFGATPAEHDYYAAKGFEASVEELVSYESVPETPDDAPPPEALATRQINDVAAWWLNRLLKASRPLQEKMTLFWHGHFATANYKVQSPELMYRQNATQRQHALGNFRDLLWEMTIDPAMLIWLDGVRNKKGAPNENYARELFELFSLGIGNYTEDDIKQAARALTGWTIQANGTNYRSGQASFNKNQHDAGQKTIFGQTGTFDAKELIELTAAHPAAGPFIATKLYCFFVAPNPNPALVQQLADLYYSSGYDIRAMVRTLLLSEDFRSPVAYRANIAGPVELIVRTLKRFGMTDLNKDQANGILNLSRRLGQLLFNPPDVSGWHGGVEWIQTSTMLDRFNFANQLATNRQLKDSGVALLLDEVKGTASTPDDVVDLLNARLLDGDLPDRMRPALIGYLTSWPEGPTPWTLDDRTLDTKVRGAIRLALASQVYQRN